MERRFGVLAQLEFSLRTEQDPRGSRITVRPVFEDRVLNAQRFDFNTLPAFRPR